MNHSILIIRGTNNKPASSKALIQFFTDQSDYSGFLFIGYPIISSAEGRHPIDALLVSPDKGFVIFDLVEGIELGDYGMRQDDAANKLEARLKTHRDLLRRREFLVPIYTISFAPRVSDLAKHDVINYPLANMGTLRKNLEGLSWPTKEAKVYQAALSAIQSISTIRKSRTKRDIKRTDSRGAKLSSLEDSIAILDSLQSRAVIETVEGVQRIRGLAGSGKTIVLALKAAYLHAQHPDWHIAVTFNTRSLKGYFRRLITNFSLEQTGEEPDFLDKLRIVNAWGAPGGIDREGIYHEFCRANEVEYLDFRAARSMFRSGDEFAGVCERALGQIRTKKPLYDAILVDEAQDFSPFFLRICYEMLSENKRLVYAYDELQNLSGASLPSPDEIFGKHPDGTSRVRFDEPSPGEPQRDIVLKVCYRNSRPVLVSAHAFGFGIYRARPKFAITNLVQMFDYPQLWEEIGYQTVSGVLNSGSNVALRRTDESSPIFLEAHSPLDDLIQFIQFKDEESQAEWLIQEIKKNLEVDELRHEDIIVINPDPYTTRQRVGLIRRSLLEQGINSHLAGIDTDPDVFFKPEIASVTFTGIYRAKGNEAGMVYIINAQDCHSSAWNLATIRNRLFTAITRSKAWVRILGVGRDMQLLIQEYERLKRKNFELHFTYPTKEQREQLKIVHRDMRPEERRRLKDREKGLLDLVADLESGVVHPEDLNNDLRDRLSALLSKKG